MAPPIAFGESPAHRWLGIERGERTDEKAELKMAAREEFIQEGGVVHGGILAALADAAAVYLLMPGLPPQNELSPRRPGRGMTSIEFKLNFLRPAIAGSDLVAEATLVKRGRTLGVCRSVVSQDGRPVAEGLFTYLFGD